MQLMNTAFVLLSLMMNKIDSEFRIRRDGGRERDHAFDYAEQQQCFRSGEYPCAGVGHECGSHRREPV